MNELFNEENLDRVKFKTISSKITVIKCENDHIQIVDSEGNIDNLIITSTTAYDILEHVRTPEVNYSEISNYYQVMTSILQYSRGILKTYQVFTRPIVSLSFLNNLRRITEFLEDENVWLTERLEEQKRIENMQFELVKILSDRLNEGLEIKGLGLIRLLAARGNTAVGKTTIMRTDPLFSKVIDPSTGVALGVLNPDTIKGILRRLLMIEVNEEMLHAVTHNQVHAEGSAINNRLIKRAFEDRLSVVLDERLVYIERLEYIFSLIKDNNYNQVDILDIDAPLIVSIARVLFRDPLRDDPVVDLRDIINGFILSRQNRDEAISLFLSENINSYKLYVQQKGMDFTKPVIDYKKGEDLKIDRFSEIIQEVLQEVDSVEKTSEYLIQQFSDKLIDYSFCDELLGTGLVTIEQLGVIENSGLIGMTIADAIDTRYRQSLEI